MGPDLIKQSSSVLVCDKILADTNFENGAIHRLCLHWKGPRIVLSVWDQPGVSRVANPFSLSLIFNLVLPVGLQVGPVKKPASESQCHHITPLLQKLLDFEGFSMLPTELLLLK